MSRPLERAERMQLPLCNDVGFMGAFWRIKGTKGAPPIANGDVGSPLPTLGWRYAKKAMRVVAARLVHVVAVLRMRCFTQVTPAIVMTNAVDVVDLFIGPFASHVEPSQPVSAERNAVNRDPKVPMTLGSSDVANVHTMSYAKQACEQTSLWLVVKNFTQAVRGERISISHGAVPSQSGQRPTGVDRTVSASTFYEQRC